MIAATQTATAPHISPAPAERRSIGLVVELAPDAHIRPAQLESQRGSTLTVYDGILCVTVGDDDYLLMPGDSVTLHAGARARAWNAGDDAARVIIERC